MNIFDNYPSSSDYIPDNRPKHHKKHIITIMTGETATHSFDVPFDVAEVCSSVEVFYKLGLDVVLVKEMNDLEIVSIYDEERDWHYSNVIVTLSCDETSLFRDTLLDTHVQMRFTMKDNTVEYSEIYPVKVEDSLEI